MDKGKKASTAIKIAKIIGGCAITLIAIAVLLPMGEAAMHNVNMGLLKGTEDDPAKRDSQSPVANGTKDSTAVSDQLNCGGDAAKELAMKVVKQAPPNELIAHSLNFDAVSREKKNCDAELNSAETAVKSCYDGADGATADWPNLVHLCLGDAEHEHVCQAKVAICDQSDEAAKTANKACYDKADAKADEAGQRATYSIKNIRLEGRDPTTGAVRAKKR